jgi:phosphoglucomutase
MNFMDELLRWKNSGLLTSEEMAELRAVEKDPSLAEFRFGSSMEFGTGGLRSTMYLGTSCMNRFTVAQATAGMAALVKAEGGEKRGVVIAYDSRNNSRAFAQVSAEVLAASGITVYLFDGLRPTPELSFAVRELGCLAGINITASHNPKEYNGYKAYWEDGAQIAPEQAKTVSAAIASIDVLTGAPRMPLDEAKEKGLLKMLGEDFDEIYLDAVEKTAIRRDLIREAADDLRIVYTPLHGAGCRLVPKILSRLGIRNLYPVEAQMTPDGNFPTVKKPNPEYAEVFALGVEIAEREGSDLVIATDPDADRVGVMSRTKDGSFATITGNQMGALLLDYVIRARREEGKLPEGAYAVKSIVSTDLASAIARKNGVTLHDVFTGFKFIGEVIKQHEAMGREDDFIFGFEESYGYLFGTYARDKDAVGATMMIVEMTAYYRRRGMTLSDALEEIYRNYGCYKEGVLDLYMEGLDGIERRRRLMEVFRNAPPARLGGVPVASVCDHKKQTVRVLATGEERPSGMSASDVLYYTLENGDIVVVRPSGTEPKVKFYFLCHGEDPEALFQKIDAYRTDANAIAAAV